MKDDQNDNNFRIVDPHCHFWDLSLGYNGWISDKESDLLGSLKPLNKNYLPEHYLDDTQDFDVHKVVHVEASTTQFARHEVDWATSLTGPSSLVGAIVGGADLLADDIQDLLAYYADHSLVTGIRQILNWHNNPKYTAADRSDDLTNPDWHKAFALLYRYDLSFDMQICPTQMDEAFELAKKFPDTLIIIEHAGMPITEDLETWKQGIKQLASCSNVCIKISGFGMLDHEWTTDSIAFFVHYVLDHFGIERCMFASNFPVDKLYSNFSTLMRSYYELVQNASDNEKNQLFFDNAKRIYQIG